MEKCFLFDKDNERVKEFIKLANKSDSDHKKIMEKTAEIFGIENNKFTVCTTTRGTPLISEKVAKEKGFIDKLKIIISKDFQIKDENGNYLGQWCGIKGNRKEFKEISKFINTLNLYKGKYGLEDIPNIKDIIIGKDIDIKGQYYIDYNYGIFFLLTKENDFESEKFKEAFKDAIEYKISDFYKIKEEKENGR